RNACSTRASNRSADRCRRSRSAYARRLAPGSGSSGPRALSSTEPVFAIEGEGDEDLPLQRGPRGGRGRGEAVSDRRRSRKGGPSEAGPHHARSDRATRERARSDEVGAFRHADGPVPAARSGEAARARSQPARDLGGGRELQGAPGGDARKNGLIRPFGPLQGRADGGVFSQA